MRITDFILLALLTTCIFLIIIDIVRLTDEKMNCVNNPLVYGVDKFSKANNDNLLCSCYFLKSPGWIMTIDSSGMKIDSPVDSSQPEVNYSDIIKGWK